MPATPLDRFRQRHRVPGSPALRERDERLAALKLVIGRMSHDFNNYLAPILGYIALLNAEEPEAWRYDEQARVAEHRINQ